MTWVLRIFLLTENLCTTWHAIPLRHITNPSIFITDIWSPWYSTAKTNWTISWNKNRNIQIGRWYDKIESNNFTLKIPDIDSVKLDVCDNKRNSLISIANAIIAPQVIFNANETTSNGINSDDVSDNLRSSPPICVFFSKENRVIAF